EYDKTETLIRSLLGASGVRARSRPDTTPTGLLTPETYLGYSRLANYVGTAISPDLDASYRLPDNLPQNTLAYGGRWHVDAERIVALPGALLRLHLHAKGGDIVPAWRATLRAFVAR